MTKNILRGPQSRRDFLSTTAALGGGAALGTLGAGISDAQAAKLSGTFWFNQPFQADAFNNVINRFKNGQDKAELEFVLVPQSEISTKLATAIAGGDIPSAARLGGPGLNSLFIDRGQAKALDDLSPGISDLDWIPAVRESVSRDGKMYALPINSGCMCLLYNRDLYEASGLDPDEPPATLADLLEYSGKISKPEQQKWGHYLLTAPNHQTGGHWFHSILWAFGADVASADHETIVFNSPEGVDALTWYYDMIRVAKSMPVKQVTEVVMLNDFLTGSVGSIFAYPSVLARVANANFKAGSARRPAGPHGGTVPIGFGSIMVFEKSATWEAGWEFANFIGMNPENAAFWNISFGQLPARYSYRDTGIWKEYAASQPLVTTYTDAQRDAKLTYIGPGVTEIATRLGKAIESVTFGQQTPKQALDAAAKDAQRILDRENRRMKG